MDLRSWITHDHADVCRRISDQVLARIPRDRWNDTPDGGEGSSILWILWHTVRHQDVALNAVVRQQGDLLAAVGPDGRSWAERTGAQHLAPGAGLSEAADRDAAIELDPDGVEAYARAVWAETAGWLAEVDLDELDRIPAATAALERLGVTEDGYPWLHRMWTDQPASFHVSWETLGHAYNHLGEMVHVRNRLGYGGF